MLHISKDGLVHAFRRKALSRVIQAPKVSRPRQFNNRATSGSLPRALFFGTIWPEPSASAAGVRTMSLLQLTRDMGWDVHFCAPARLRLAPISTFDAKGVKAHGLPAVNSSEVDDLVALIRPDVVIFDRFITEEMFGWRVRSVCPDAAHVIDTQDLHFLRHARQHVLEEHLVYTDPNSMDSTLPPSNLAYSSAPTASMATLLEEGALAPQRRTPRSHNPYPSPYSSHAHATEAQTPLSLIPDVEYYRNVLARNGPLVDPLDAGDRFNIIHAAKTVNVLKVAKRYPAFHASLMRELAAIHRADLTFVVSDYEKDLLVRQLGISPNKLVVAPFYYEDIPHQKWKSYKAKNGFSMIGHFKHPPNRDAILWMKNDIWPRIRRHLPQATLDIFGAHPDKEDMNLSDPTMGFRVVGTLKAEELTTRLQRARINLAPLRYGAGIKGKIAENWYAGTPIVTTSIGAESMMMRAENSHGGRDRMEFGGVVADTAEAFAHEAVALYIDHTRWHHARGTGYEILSSLFSKQVNGPVFQDALWKVIEQREKLREENVVGAILWSAGYRYNEMFGRFIQMKNLASQQQASRFVEDTKKEALQAQTSRAEANPAMHRESYPTEKEDQEINTTRGLDAEKSDEKATSKRESHIPVTKTKSPFAKEAVVDPKEEENRKFVFNVLAQEHARLDVGRQPKPTRTQAEVLKMGLSENDEAALSALKRNLR